MKLVIGNRNYSSWSLRAWLFLVVNDIAFEEVRLSLFADGWPDTIDEYSEARRVPVLIDGGIRVWDSLAIIEYLNDRYATTVGWPRRYEQLAHARSIVAEMHAGFLAVRAELPQNIRARHSLSVDSLSADCRSQLARIDSIWSGCRNRYRSQGPWLFGTMTIADVIYAPVALRLITYGLTSSADAAEFVEAVAAHPAVKQWSAAASTEPEALEFIDRLTPIDQTPLTQG